MILFFSASAARCALSEAGKGIERRVAAILRGRGIRGRTPEHWGPFQTLRAWITSISPVPIERPSRPEDPSVEETFTLARKAIQTDCHRKWQERWRKGQKGAHSRILQPTLSPKTVSLHRKLRRPQSSIIIQLRTGKIGFRAFLFNRKVPDINSPWCLSCDGQELETVQHILLKCPAWKELREECFKNGFDEGVTPSLRMLLGTEKGCRAAARMIQRTGLLSQYSACEVEEPRRE